MMTALNSRRIVLGLLIIVQFAVPLGMIQGREKILNQGKVFRFIIQPVDPIDPFQGRYVNLNLQQDFIQDTEQAAELLEQDQKIFAVISTGPDGFSFFSSWSVDRPVETNYMSVKANGISQTWEDNERTVRGIRIATPISRFYMDETKAPKAERLVAQRNPGDRSWVQVRVLRGKVVIENIFMNGVEISELVDAPE